MVLRNVVGRYLHTSAIVYNNMQSRRRIIHFGGVDIREIPKTSNILKAIPVSETAIHDYSKHYNYRLHTLHILNMNVIQLMHGLILMFQLVQTTHLWNGP